MDDRKARPQHAATLMDVALALGVSRTTVSNAFNRPDQLSAELRNRILSTARALGYPGPNPVARQLRTGRAGAIGVVFWDVLPYALTDPTAVALLKGIAEVCQRNETGLLILPASSEETARLAIRQAAVDGFILYSIPDDSRLIEAFIERGAPLAAVDVHLQAEVPTVTVDDYGGGRQAAESLLALGHRRFGILTLDLAPDGLSGPADEARLRRIRYGNIAERLNGYRDALLQAGIDTIHIEEQPGNDEDGGRQAALRLLARSPRPTAILAMSDRYAIGVLRAASELGLEVPRDLSVIGFDDIPIAAQMRPSLTTIRQPLEEKGRLAAAILLEESEPPLLRRLATELVVRETTGPAPR